jgi:glycine hydroxymethyltransferase
MARDRRSAARAEDDMAELHSGIGARVAPNETDKGLAAKTRAAIARTFANLAARETGDLGGIIAGTPVPGGPPIDDLQVLRGVATSDPELAAAVALNEAQWRNYLVMIPSMNAARREVRALLSSRLTDVYAEGYELTGRYYTGTGPSSVVEDLACERACRVFHAKHATVQALSGAPANSAIYMALLAPGLPEFRTGPDGERTPVPNHAANPADRVLALSLSEGGHLTHGLFLNFSAKFFDFRHYGVDANGFVDYDRIETLAKEIRPRMILLGASAYPRDYDYARVRRICDSLEPRALLMVDMAHYAGLVAAGLLRNPLDEGADVVAFTTHKTLGGPRGAIVLTNDAAIHDKVRAAIFPGLQGGAHFNNIAGIAWILGFAETAEFRTLATRIRDDARALAAALVKRGVRLCTGGTDNHLILVDLRGQGFTYEGKELTGRTASECLERSGLIINRNGVPKDTRKPWITSGIRMGTNVLAARGMEPPVMDEVAELVCRVLRGAGDPMVEDEVLARVYALTAQYPI